MYSYDNVTHDSSYYCFGVAPVCLIPGQFASQLRLDLKGGALDVPVDAAMWSFHHIIVAGLVGALHVGHAGACDEDHEWVWVFHYDPLFRRGGPGYSSTDSSTWVSYGVGGAVFVLIIHCCVFVIPCLGTCLRCARGTASLYQCTSLMCMVNILAVVILTYFANRRSCDSPLFVSAVLGTVGSCCFCCCCLVMLLPEETLPEETVAERRAPVQIRSAWEDEVTPGARNEINNAGAEHRVGDVAPSAADGTLDATPTLYGKSSTSFIDEDPQKMTNDGAPGKCDDNNSAGGAPAEEEPRTL